MNINQLNEYCLLAIFEHLPLVKLLQIGCVCRHWYHLQPAACARVHKLTLTCAERAYSPPMDQLPSTVIDDPLHHRSSHLLVQQLTKSVAYDIGYLFPSIHSLEYFNTTFYDEELAYLFNQWSGSLHRLVVVIHQSEFPYYAPGVVGWSDTSTPLDGGSQLFSATNASIPRD